MARTTESAGVLSFQQAQEVVREYCTRIRAPLTQEVALPNAIGRVLAESVRADRDFPPFPRSTRDGYAVRAADVESIPARLRVIGQIKAGGSFNEPIHGGEAVEIMTGAAVPDGADAVVMVEQTAQAAPGSPAGEIEVRRSVAPGENIVAAGSEARLGTELLSRGTRLNAPHIAMAAAAGKCRLQVFVRPRVAILSTGDELVEVAEKPGPFQIRNSNTYSLSAQATLAGGDPMRLSIAPDEPRQLAKLLHSGLSADLMLISGGVSMGKFDLVEAVLKRMGAEFFFTGALIQPGRPVVFGQVPFSSQTNGSSDARNPSDPVGVKRFGGVIPFFGLPGNPISAMVCFDLFARSVIEAHGGATPSRLPAAKARLQKEVKTKTGLTRFLPAALSGGLDDPEVETIAWQGSGDLLAAAKANCYLVIPPDRDCLAAGEMVSVLVRF
jgi:molybdopterin molybdotransferase